MSEGKGGSYHEKQVGYQGRIVLINPEPFGNILEIYSHSYELIYAEGAY